MFTSRPSYNYMRTLEQKTPAMQGEDVYALQTALTECDIPCGTADGVLGPLTDRAIREAQRFFDLVVDGKAGAKTHQALAIALGAGAASRKGVPSSAVRGQIEGESSYWLGAYSAAYPDGSYDAGLCQRNTRFTSPENGFDAAKSATALATEIRKHYDLFAGLPPRRRWQLAQGAWNAPAFACYIAREEGAKQVTAGMTLKPSSEARATLEAYIERVSKYLTVT